MRARNHLTPDEWQARLDAEMERVLRNPDDFDPSVVIWARWRREWLAEQVQVTDSAQAAGPSSRPARAGGPDRTRELAVGSKK